jgi:hypothetical protein
VLIEVSSSRRFAPAGRCHSSFVAIRLNHAWDVVTTICNYSITSAIRRWRERWSGSWGFLLSVRRRAVTGVDAARDRQFATAMRNSDFDHCSCSIVDSDDQCDHIAETPHLESRPLPRPHVYFRNIALCALFAGILRSVALKLDRTSDHAVSASFLLVKTWGGRAGL